MDHVQPASDGGYPQLKSCKYLCLNILQKGGSPSRVDHSTLCIVPSLDYAQLKHNETKLCTT